MSHTKGQGVCTKMPGSVRGTGASGGEEGELLPPSGLGGGTEILPPSATV